MSDPIMAETEQMALILAGEAAAEPNIPIAVLLERSANRTAALTSSATKRKGTDHV